MLEADYPYTAKDGVCQYVESKGVVRGHGYKAAKSESVSSLLATIAEQVTSVRLHVSDSFRAYSSGIYDDKECGDQINHAINAVGYGKENGVQYVIIRNSWGTSWGEDGYMKIAATEDGPGICAVQMGPSAIPQTN